MSSRFHATVRVLLLVFYGIYSLSPIYASAGSCAGRCFPVHEHGYSVGIVWVNVLLSALADEIGSDPADETSVSQDDPDLILIKKKRAVLREQRVAAPPTFATSVPKDISTVPGPSSYRVQEVPLDLKHRESDGYSTLNAGLSPPPHLS